MVDAYLIVLITRITTDIYTAGLIIRMAMDRNRSQLQFFLLCSCYEREDLLLYQQAILWATNLCCVKVHW